MKRRFILRGRRRRLPPIEDDGLVSIHQHIVTPEWVEANARHHMQGFDELPKPLRDKINYAPTPELGALPTSNLVGPGGPFDVEDRRMAARELARLMIKAKLRE